jgi:hypothetical protein
MIGMERQDTMRRDSKKAWPSRSSQKRHERSGTRTRAEGESVRQDPPISPKCQALPKDSLCCHPRLTMSDAERKESQERCRRHVRSCACSCL